VRRFGLSRWFALSCGEVGNDLVEYGLLIATIAIIVLVATINFGSLIKPWLEGLALRIVTNT
jgi:Flp pilus assembly pilin Flp